MPSLQLFKNEGIPVWLVDFIFITPQYSQSTMAESLAMIHLRSS